MRLMSALIGIYRPSSSRIQYPKQTKPNKEQEEIPKTKPPKTPEQLNQERLLALHKRFWKPPFRL